MLNSLPEAEKQITQGRLDLEKAIFEIKQLRADIRALQAQAAIVTTNTEITSSSSSIDSSIVRNIVYHKLKHWFEKTVTFVADILPSVDNVVDIGATATRFKKIWCYTIAVSGLTANRILLGGATINDDANLTWDGAAVTVKNSSGASSGQTSLYVDCPSGAATQSRFGLKFNGTLEWLMYRPNASSQWVLYDVVTGVSRMIVTQAGTVSIDGNILTTTTTLGLFGATPAAKQTLNAYTSDGEGAAYTGLATGLAATPYAAVADLNQLRVAYEALRASYDDLRTKLQTTTLVG